MIQFLYSSKKALDLFLRCLGLNIVAKTLVNFAIYVFEETAWHQVFSVKPFHTWSINDSKILIFFYQAVLSVTQAPYYLMKYFRFQNTNRFFWEPVLIAPILEEIIFRAPLLLLFKLNKKEWWLSAMLLNLLFTFGHSKPILYLVTTFILGFLSSYLIYSTKKLWPSILLHSAMNSLYLSQSLAS